MTGQGHWSMAWNIVSKRSASCLASNADTVRSGPIQRRSAPAQNVSPAPPRTMTRTERSCPNVSKARRISSTIAASKALRRSDRFNVTRAKPFSDSTRIDIGCPLSPSHKEHLRMGPPHRHRHRNVQTQTEDRPGIYGIDNAVIPEPGRAEKGAAFSLVLGDRRIHDSALLISGHRRLFTGPLLLLHGDKYLGGLLRSHDRCACIGPQEEEARTIGPSAHRIIAGSVRGANDDGEFRHIGGCHGLHHFGAVLDDSPCFIVLAYHEAGDVLKKDQGQPPLSTELHEMRPFQRCL